MQPLLFRVEEIGHHNPQVNPEFYWQYQWYINGVEFLQAKEVMQMNPYKSKRDEMRMDPCDAQFKDQFSKPPDLLQSSSTSNPHSFFTLALHHSPLT